jgi:hypothetical protein
MLIGLIGGALLVGKADAEGVTLREGEARDLEASAQGE